ncbi:MAG: heme exporter protein CcmB [Leptospira sp.]|nr:heme exporter protein CcmB [Leptospira sp.]
MIGTLLKKEFLIIGRAKNGILSMFVLMLSLIFIFHYALEKTAKIDQTTLIGLKWAVLFIISFVLISQSIWEERESGAYRINLVLIPGAAFYLCKSVVIFSVIAILQMVEILLFSIFFESFKLNVSALGDNLIFFLPGGLALTFLGVSLSLLSFSTRLKEMILPLLLIPLSMPIFLLGMEAERRLFTSKIYSTNSIVIVTALCILYGTLGVMLQDLTEAD